MDILKIAIWKRLQHRILELKTFLHNNEIDIMLIAETHFTVKNYIKIPLYNVYDTNHPSGRARGSSTIIIKQDIKHNIHHSIADTLMQAVTWQHYRHCLLPSEAQNIYTMH